jgi:hypothetical protein
MLRDRPAWRLAWFGRLALFLALVLFLGCGRSEERKAAPSLPGREFAVRYHSELASLSASEGQSLDVPVRVRNAGHAVWSSSGHPPCFLSFHLRDERGSVLRWDNARFPFPRDVGPGESCSLEARVKAPLEPGRYRVEFDLVREGVAWLGDLGSPTLTLELKVSRRTWPEDRYSLGLEPGPFTRLESSRPEINRLWRLVRITLDHDEVSFRGTTGKVSGFFAGTDYPQVWLRDAATIIPASRYYYGRDFLSSWLLEHLARQGIDGSLEDWVNGAGGSDKNTTETDQEASAVQAAARISRLEGLGWLNDKVQGRTIIDRLEAALRYVLAERLDERTDLVKSAHTIDWGDVDIEDADDRATDVDSGSHWVAGVYTQAMFYQAATDLAWMLDGLGRKDKALFWTVRAASLREKTDRWLWQADRGFYRVHVHLSPGLKHAFDEDDLFALGGNVAAVLSKLADETKAQRILETALARQKACGLSTVGGVLLPPYPRGVFKHPLVDEPYEYQNGGQWDWFGGRLVLALFLNGFSRTAADKLLEIAAKDLANGGLFEWDDRQGSARGSDFYAGSAGSLARAIVEGYFGVRLDADSLTLEPRLGTDSGRIHVYLPAAGRFAACDYRPDREGRSLVFSFNSDFPGRGEVRVGWPWPSPDRGAVPIGTTEYEVRLDGRSVPFRLSRVNEDEYIVLETDFRRHRLEVTASGHGGSRERGARRLF